MNFYNYLINLLPPIYRNENTLKRYKIISNQLDLIFRKIKELNNKFIIQNCDSDTLLILGSNVEVFKNGFIDWDTYRRLVMVEYFKLLNTPTHNNIVEIAKKTTNSYPKLEKLSLYGNKPENDQGYMIIYELPVDFVQTPLEKIENFIGAGIKIKRQFVTKLDGANIYFGQSLYNTGIVKIGGV